MLTILFVDNIWESQAKSKGRSSEIVNTPEQVVEMSSYKYCFLLICHIIILNTLELNNCNRLHSFAALSFIRLTHSDISEIYRPIGYLRSMVCAIMVKQN